MLPYIWTLALCITAALTAVCLIASGPILLLGAATVLCLAVALFGAVVVGFMLTAQREVIRAAVLGAGTLTVSAVLGPIAVMDVASPSCSTQDCDLVPSVGGLAFFIVSTLIFVGLIGGGYALRTRHTHRDR